MLTRRDLVEKLAAGAAAVCAVGVAHTALASTTGRAKTADPRAGSQESPSTTYEHGPFPPPEGGRGVVDEGPPATLSEPAPWELLRPLAAGSAVAYGWRVAGLTGVVDGSSVLTLENERGRAQRVHLCRNDGTPRGLIHTEFCDLVVMNGGSGDLPTEETFAQALARVAHVLAANERAAAPAVTALLPHAERLERFAGGADRRLR